MSTKSYSVKMENEAVVSVEVDGIHYASPDEIPDPEDRDRINLMISSPADEEFDEVFDDQEFEAEFRRIQEETSRFPKLLVAIFLGVAGIMLAIAAFSAFNAVRTQSREQSAPGQVVALVASRTRDSNTGEIKAYTYPVVEFAAPGQPLQTVQMSVGSWPPAYAEGDSVTVLYDPQQPRNARIKSFSSTLLLWLLPVLSTVLGGSFLIATLFAIKVWRSNRDALEETPLLAARPLDQGRIL